MSLSLKHIPCPAGNTCTAFQCIFGHERDKLKVPVAASSNGEFTSRDQHQRGMDDDLPRKRQKLDHREGSRDAGGSKSETEIKSISNHATEPSTKLVKGKLASNKAKTAARQISPPPLRRAPRDTDKASSQDSNPSQKLAKDRKTESLNPRLLKAAPASHEIRLKLLKLLYAEFKRLNDELKKDGTEAEMKLALSDQDLVHRALDDEQDTAVQKASVYANVMKNKVMQHKRMGASQWKDQRAKEEASATTAADTDSSEEPIKINTGLTPAQELQVVADLLTPIEDLFNHGYVSKIPSEEAIEAARQGVEAAKGWEKCDRCMQRFQVFPGRREEDGALTSGGACLHHWGKPYLPAKPPGSTARISKRYKCCGQEVGESAGCTVLDFHVFKAGDPKRLALALNFAETPKNASAPTDRAVAFDCEMCYTVLGMELVRLTATSWPSGEELLDVLVQPYGEILDLNSRFSGVWPHDMAAAQPWTPPDVDSAPSKSGSDVTEEGQISSKEQSKSAFKIVPSVEAARELLFKLISPKSILIGHGLENDLNATRIVHPFVVDTVLLYPHRAGLPFRYGLKMLMEKHLNRKIQQDDLGPKTKGHDSAEDARAAGDLVRLKVSHRWDRMKQQGWKIVGDKLEPKAVATKSVDDLATSDSKGK